MVMTLPVSARERIRFTPATAGDAPEPPVYLIQVPSVLGRAQWQRAVAGLGARYWTDAEMLEALRDGIAALDEPAQAAERLDLVERAAARDPRQEADAALGRALAALERRVRRADPAYAAMVADREFWMVAAPFLAARRFLAGWENLHLAFQRDEEGVTAELVERLPEGHALAIGWRAIAAMTPSEAQAKN